MVVKNKLYADSSSARKTRLCKIKADHSVSGKTSDLSISSAMEERIC